MRQAIIVIIVILISSFNVSAKKRPIKESEYIKTYCKRFGGVIEYKLKDGTFVDCLTDDEAIEFDFADKWAEAVGQSLHYAIMSGKKPAIALIVLSEKEFRFVKKVININNEFGLNLNIYMIKDL